MKNLQSLAFALLCLFYTTSTFSQNAFSGVFHQIEDRTHLAQELTWEALLQQHKTLRTKGFQLIDVETIEQADKRMYYGLWLQDTAKTVLQYIPGWDSLVQIKRKMVKEGYLMTDLEAYPGEDGRTHFIGVWKANKIWHKVWKLDTWEGILQKNTEMVEKYLYIRDIEIVKKANGAIQYLAVFHKGDRERKERSYVFKSSDLKVFSTDLLRRQKSGFSMIDIEQFEENGKKVYVAIYQKWIPSDTWRQNLNKESFEAHAKALKESSFQLVDLEVYEGEGRLLIPIAENTAAKTEK